MIQFDETEFQDGFTTRSLLIIEDFHGKDIANILDSPVVKIDVEKRKLAS